MPSASSLVSHFADASRCSDVFEHKKYLPLPFSAFSSKLSLPGLLCVVLSFFPNFWSVFVLCNNTTQYDG